MLVVYHLRRWPDIKPAQGKRVVFTGRCLSHYCNIVHRYWVGTSIAELYYLKVHLLKFVFRYSNKWVEIIHGGLTD